MLIFHSYAVKNALKVIDQMLKGVQPSIPDLQSSKQLLLASYDGQDSNYCQLEKQLERYDPDTRAALLQISLGKRPMEIPSLPVKVGNTPRQAIPRQLRMQLLRATTSWNFDPFELDVASGGKPLSNLFLWLVDETGLIDRLGLNPSKLRHFAVEVESGYGDNPYHNRIHVCAVLQRLHIILLEGGVGKAIKDETGLLILAAYIAATCHDFRHKGVTNDFLVRSGDDLALYYNDQAPHENYHLTQTFALLNMQHCNVLADLPADARQYVRELVINMVLATDMSRHMQYSNSFTARANATDPWESEEAKVVALQMAIKAADLSHTTAPWNEHRHWVSRLQSEFWAQGQKEIALGLPVSPLTDKNKQGLLTSQVGFFDVLVLPMFDSLCKAFPQCQFILNQAKENSHKWKHL